MSDSSVRSAESSWMTSKIYLYLPLNIWNEVNAKNKPQRFILDQQSTEEKPD